MHHANSSNFSVEDKTETIFFNCSFQEARLFDIWIWQENVHFLVKLWFYSLNKDFFLKWWWLNESKKEQEFEKDLLTSLFNKSIFTIRIFNSKLTLFHVIHFPTLFFHFRFMHTIFRIFQSLENISSEQ